MNNGNTNLTEDANMEQLKRIVLYDDDFFFKLISVHLNSEEIIIKHADHLLIDWLDVYNKAKFSPLFFDNFIDRIDWNDIYSGEDLQGTYSAKFIFLMNKKVSYDLWEEVNGSNISIVNQDELFEQFHNDLDWDSISICNKINWSIELIDNYKENWNWSRLSENKALPWRIDLIDEFQDMWDWQSLSRNNLLPWSEDLVRKYESRWDWINLSKNSSITWPLKLIQEYSHRLNFGKLSYSKERLFYNSIANSEKIDWTEELIEKYKDSLNWVQLSRNNKIPLTIYLIEKYINRWSWEVLSENRGVWENIEIVNKFQERWDWKMLTIQITNNNDFNLLHKFISTHKDRLDWEIISSADEFPFTSDLIEKYKEYFIWKSLSSNTKISWTQSLIDKFENRWDWRLLTSSLAYTQTLNSYLLEKYYKKWDWPELSNYYAFSLHDIEKFSDKIDWNELSYNENLLWSTKLIEEYIKLWDWDVLSLNKSLYDKIFKDLSNDKIEELLLHVINNKKREEATFQFKNLDIQVDPSWQSFFKEHQSLLTTIEQNIGEDYTPSNPQDIFKIFHLPIDAIRFVVVGQDPYFNKGEATGRSFERELEVWNGSNPSLQAISSSIHFYETNEFIDVTERIPELALAPSKLFKEWEKEKGVFFLNKSLTTKVGKPNFHASYWEEFLKELVTLLGENEKIRWLLWGGEAQKLEVSIPNKENIIKTIHPAAYSYVNGIEKNERFRKFIKESGLNLILKSTQKRHDVK